MTSAQRLFFEVNGYVVIEHTLTQSEGRNLLTALSVFHTRFEAEVNPAEAIIDGSRWERYDPPQKRWIESGRKGMVRDRDVGQQDT